MDPLLVALVGTIDLTNAFQWAGLAALMASVYLIATFVTWLGIAVAAQPWKRSAQQHWSERARQIWPARKSAAGLSALIIFPLALVANSEGQVVEFLPPIVTNFLLVAAGWTGWLQARIWWERRFNPAYALTTRPGRAAWIANLAAIGVLLISIFVLIGVVPDHGGAVTWAILATGAAFVGVYLNWIWMLVMRAAGLIRPAGDRLAAIVSAIADRMEVRPNSVVEMSLPMANAFAIIAHKSLAMTDAALAVLSDDEITAVCAHELAHLSEPRSVKAMRISNGFVIGALVALPAAIGVIGTTTSAGPFLAVILVAAICLVWLILHARLGRRMEIRADALGRQFEPAPGVYANALQKIYATNLVPMVALARKHSHPELYDRMVEAGAPPDYPRPLPPATWPLRLGLLVMLAGTAAGCYALYWLASAIANF